MRLTLCERVGEVTKTGGENPGILALRARVTSKPEVTR
jgi:hypothetical protein